jgi:hypothetical protein
LLPLPLGARLQRLRRPPWLGCGAFQQHLRVLLRFGASIVMLLLLRRSARRLRLQSL